MKTKLFVIVCFGSGIINSHAQYTFNTCGTHQVFGSSVITQSTTYDTTGVVPGNAGNGVTWDFSTLSKPVVGANDTVTYLDPSKTPGFSLFPKATIASHGCSGCGYSYSNTVADSILTLGSYTSATNYSINTNPDKQIVCPFAYGNNYSETSYLTVPNDNSYHMYTSKTVTYDGYGTLKLPSGTYSNVVRLHTAEHTVDSILSIKGYASVSDINSYTWMNEPSGTVMFSILNGAVGSYKYKYVTYTSSNDVSTGISLVSSHQKNSIVLLPNPCRMQSAVSLQLAENASVHMVLYNSLGQEVSTIENKFLESGNYKYDLNVSGKGIYFLRSIIDGVPSVQKLIDIE